MKTLQTAAITDHNTPLSREITPNSKPEAHGMEMTSFAPEKFSGGGQIDNVV